jgi:hypothetical protein
MEIQRLVMTEIRLSPPSLEKLKIAADILSSMEELKRKISMKPLPKPIEVKLQAHRSGRPPKNRDPLPLTEAV